ncbi:MAG: hypothetical protein ACKPEN_11060 [Planktothrix sp.]|uniref:hypothetical protein n=1 Tax=Planktothrix sp. TaxID=3088171 RepID=UPI0038D3A206
MMLTYPRKQYRWLIALPLLTVMNASPSFAYPESTTLSHQSSEPSTFESRPPDHSKLDSLLSGPQVSRRISECYDNGLC